ncbi:MAG TPA: malonyl-CoA synthase [Rhizomicrobium sp.]|jgi:malonyl-CoA/methylmalonyl-CoA synthetase
MSFFARIRAAMPGAEQVFLETANGSVTYGDAFARSGQIANVLWDAGLRPGDRLIVQTEKSAEVLLLYLACLRAGAVYLPLNTAYTLAELEYFLQDAEPRIVVVSPDREETIAPLARRHGARAVFTLGSSDGTLPQRANAMQTAFDDVKREDGDLGAILYTSGTTGRSKGAMLTQRNLASNAAVLKAFWHFTQNDVLLHALPLYHAHGLFTATNTVLMAGASMILLPKFEVDPVFAALPRATVMMGVPTYYLRLLQDERLTRETAAHMRLFVSGSAPLLAETHREFCARTGHAILERYGMSETNMIASNPYDGERVAGTVGMPLPGIELRIAEAETGSLLPPGEIGVVELRGPNVCAGYWRMPDKTRSEFRSDGFFITGDLGMIDRRGYLQLVGRAKDLVISGGLNVYPKEVEAEIDALPGIVESAIVGLPHADLGEAVVAIVVLREGAVLSEADLLDALRDRLAKFKLPKRVIFVDHLPRNAMGKVQKNILRDTYRAL